MNLNRISKYLSEPDADPSGAVGQALPTLLPLYLIIKIHISVKKTHYSEVTHHHYLLMRREHSVLWFDMLLRCDTAQWFLSTPLHLYTYIHIAATRQFDTCKNIWWHFWRRTFFDTRKNPRVAGHRTFSLPLQQLAGGIYFAKVKLISDVYSFGGML